MKQHSPLRLVLLATTMLGFQALAPREADHLPGWGADLVIIHQPDFDPDRPLAPWFGTTTAAASGQIVYASATLRPAAGVAVDSTALPDLT